MKLKQSPDDFVVEELTDVAPSDGPFALYKLDKTGWTTPDALAAIRRRWQIDLRRLHYGGLKDRHAQTTQFLTIFQGPKRNLDHERIQVAYLGQVPEPYGPQAIRANRFTLVLRALDQSHIATLRRAAEEVASVGVPNYFDDQRFGSVRVGGAFIAAELAHGRFEDALKLALADPYEHDRAEAKREKAILRAHWNNWSTCKTNLPRSHARSIVDYLVTHPTDFRGAIARLRPELQGLYLSAFQSHIWNRMVANWLTGQLGADVVPLRLKLGEVPAPRRAPHDSWATLECPLPSARWKPLDDDPWRPHAIVALAEHGLTLETMRVPGMQKPFFSKGERAVCVMPNGLEFSHTEDDRHPRRRKVQLKFELGRGSYATMIVKRITTSVTSPTHETRDK
jgi:tRNA pseudouridine13 synthase